VVQGGGAVSYERGTPVLASYPCSVHSGLLPCQGRESGPSCLITPATYGVTSGPP